MERSYKVARQQPKWQRAKFIKEEPHEQGLIGKICWVKCEKPFNFSTSNATHPFSGKRGYFSGKAYESNIRFLGDTISLYIDYEAVELLSESEKDFSFEDVSIISWDDFIGDR